MSNPNSGDRLPFEPRQKKKKTPKTSPSPTPTETVAKSTKTVSLNTSEKNSSQKTSRRDNTIPEVVSKRMIRRMALFSGIPTASGVAILLISYTIVIKGLYDLPTIVPLLLSMGGFGLGVLGLSYGVLSTSWDEDRLGSWWGWEEFTINFGRMVNAWRSANQVKSKK